MKVVIIGGGASGVFCAINIKKKCPYHEVTILEQNDRILKKVLKTGNGRCNICNSIIEPFYYNDFSLIEANNDVSVIKKMEDIGFLLKSEEQGRMYPYSESANVVVNTLMSKLIDSGVEVVTKYEVKSIVKTKDKSNNFLINNNLKCDYIVMATGSIAQEKTLGYDIMKSLGHTITDLRPGLVPLITREETDLIKGIRWKCTAKVVNKPKLRKLTGEVLFKEHGISGIISLDLSNMVKDRDVVSFDLMPEYSEVEINNLVTKNGNNFLENVFPKMLYFDIKRRALKQNTTIIKIIKNYNFTILGTKGYNDAQITLGGVSIKDVQNNFESKKVNNLYIVGELLDVNGASGGYNLNFAWLSGYCASRAIISKIEKI